MNDSNRILSANLKQSEQEILRLTAKTAFLKNKIKKLKRKNYLQSFERPGEENIKNTTSAINSIMDRFTYKGKENKAGVKTMDKLQQYEDDLDEVMTIFENGIRHLEADLAVLKRKLREATKYKHKE